MRWFGQEDTRPISLWTEDSMMMMDDDDRDSIGINDDTENHTSIRKYWAFNSVTPRRCNSRDRLYYLNYLGMYQDSISSLTRPKVAAKRRRAKRIRRNWTGY